MIYSLFFDFYLIFFEKICQNILQIYIKNAKITIYQLKGEENKCLIEGLKVYLRGGEKKER